MAQWLRDFVQGLGPWGLPVLAVAAVLEYLFPPFPGDTITIFGAWLAVTGELHWAWVWAAVTAGSGVGMGLDWLFGRWLALRADRLPKAADKPWWHPLPRERLVRFQYRYQRWGDWLILSNRFLPAVRAVFFVAAGGSGIPLARVLILGLVSAGLWNALLLGAGYAVGENLDELEALFRRYSTLAWAAVGLLGAAAVTVWAFRRLRARRRARTAGRTPR